MYINTIFRSVRVFIFARVRGFCGSCLCVVQPERVNPRRVYIIYAFIEAPDRLPLMSFAIPVVADASDVRARDPRGVRYSGRRLTLDACPAEVILHPARICTR